MNLRKIKLTSVKKGYKIIRSKPNEKAGYPNTDHTISPIEVLRTSKTLIEYKSSYGIGYLDVEFWEDDNWVRVG